MAYFLLQKALVIGHDPGPALRVDRRTSLRWFEFNNTLPDFSGREKRLRCHG